MVSGEHRRGPVSGQRCFVHTCTRASPPIQSPLLSPSTTKNLTRGIIMSTDELVKYTVLLYSLFADTFV